MPILKNDWSSLLAPEFSKEYYLCLRKFLIQEYARRQVYPHKNDIFNALHLTPYKETKVVILGQDPYHGANQAHGLSFSVKPQVTVPPSLRNIFQELHTDIGCPIPNHGYLLKWAEQGVLLLNTVLTVRAHRPNAHKGQGWERFTDQVIRALNQRQQPVVFVLWGRNAQTKMRLVQAPQHLIIKGPHPSPLSAHRGFFGSRPFSRINCFLEQSGRKPIDWCLSDVEL